MDNVMNEFALTVVTASAVAALIIEGIKWVIRYVKKDMAFDFPVKFYLFLMPVLTYLSQPLLGWLGVGEYSIPTDLLLFVKQALTVALSSIGSLIIYNHGISSLADHAKERMLTKKK